MRYLDFDLEIGPGNDRNYPVTVHSSAGETSTIMHFPFDKDVLEDYLTKLQNALLDSGGMRRQSLSLDQQEVQEFGQRLFEALFAGELGQQYMASRQYVAELGLGLRLRFHTQAPELAKLPWEYLYDHEEGEYVCLSRTTSIMRYLGLSRPIRPLIITPPLRILAMIASPIDQPPLDRARERERLQTAISDLEARGLIKLEWLNGQTWPELQRAMLSGPWHIFHFIGHGTLDRQANESALALADDNGQTNLIHATLLGQMLADHRTLRLVTLDASTGGQRDIFSSTASTLVRCGLPAVLAIQDEITDRAAIEWSRAFYSALAAGLTVDEALFEARIAISLSVRNTLEWGALALYLSTSNGTLFGTLFDLPPPALTEQVRDPGSWPVTPSSLGPGADYPRLPGRAPVESLSFTAFHPKEAAVEVWNTLLVYTHIASALQAIRADASRFKPEIGDTPREAKSQATRPVARGTHITIAPKCKGVTFNPQRFSFTWIEDWHRAEFRFQIDKILAGSAGNGEITIFAGPLIIGTMKIAMLFEELPSLPQGNVTKAEVTTKQYRQVFASYSHKDIRVVLACRNTYNALGDDVLIDIDSLRSGQAFQPALMELIDTSDIFQLFWSARSAQSPYVRREWEYALQQSKGEGFIRPVYWEQPMVPPPPLLEQLHFDFQDLPELTVRRWWWPFR